MQKATYYDNAGLFGGYTYPKPDSYNYGPQSYTTATLESDYQGSVCPIQTPAVRPPALKDADLNGDCMRQSSNQSNSNQDTSTGEQPGPPLSASSPSPNSSSQKKKSSSSSASNNATPAITKQIFPWMKETRQNAKQKGNNCAAAGRDDGEGQWGAQPGHFLLLITCVICDGYDDMIILQVER